MTRTRIAAAAVVATAACALAAPAAAQGDPAAEALRAAGEAFFKQADTLIDDRNYASTTTAHYKVKTDDPRFDTKQAGALLESVYTFFDSLFASRMTLRSLDRPGRLYLFYSNFKYKQLFEGGTAGASPPPGHYRSWVDAIVIHTDTVPAGDLADILVHEATHHLVRRRIIGDDHEPSQWLTEGLADYLGYTLRDKEGSFVAGKIGPKNVALLRGIPQRSEGLGGLRLRSLKTAVKREEVPDLAAILDAGPTEFYGAGRDLHYAGAWILVHMLLHTEPAAFAKYLEQEAAGNGSPEVLHATVGLDEAALQRRFLEYVDTLKAR